MKPSLVSLSGRATGRVHFLRILRGVIIKDASMTSLGPDIWPLALFFVVGMVFATLRFRKRLD
ncbi:MAG: hypothetical protein O2780_09340 [Proteobacteria bacterium]|jgi:ABC-2 type transport system permease protein|nr:hypothetical protein [Pseudomonadota bacterium]MDA1301264.1 hypothetical protein [Pseudomonadota bacterium]